VKIRDVRYFGETVMLPDLPDYRKFYRKLEAGAWEPNTFRVLADNLDKSTLYIDIGGWIGVTPLWASHRAKQVFIVEPDPACRAILRELCPHYPNVTLLDGALSPRRSLTLNAVDGFGSSETTALAVGSRETFAAVGISVAEIMRHAAGERIFVKIDIEGYELKIAGEIARFADYPLIGMQCAVHPEIYERAMGGGRLARRARTFMATLAFARMHRGLSASPAPTIYASIFSYLVFGVLFRAVPKGIDMIFTPRARKPHS
jgi:FkbM family methyltransferase